MVDNVIPPHPWNRYPFHWLHSERASAPSIGQWMNNQWYLINENGPVSSQELARRGWEWFAPSIAPKHPIYDN